MVKVVIYPNYGCKSVDKILILCKKKDVFGVLRL